MTNPIEIIKRDHRSVETLFKEYEDVDDQAFETKKKIVDRITQELRLHTRMEETLFYPKVKEIFEQEDKKMVEEAHTEHEVARRLLEELSVTHTEDPQFDARVKVLNENVTHHIMEEEEELLPKAENLLSKEDLERIGEEMQAFKLEHEHSDE